MRPLLLIILVAGTSQAFSQTVADLEDKSDPYPYSAIKSEPVDHTRTPLVLKLTSNEDIDSPRLVADVLVYNNADRLMEVLMKSGGFWSTLIFEATNASGQPVPLQPLYAEILKQRHEGSSTLWPQLSPGQSMHFYMNLAKEYRFARGKNYRVRVSLHACEPNDDSDTRFRRLTSAWVNLSIP